MTSSVVSPETDRRPPEAAAALDRAPATGRQEMLRPLPLSSLHAPTAVPSAADGAAPAAHAPEPPAEDLSLLRVVPAKHPGRLVLALLVGLAVLVVLYSFVTNPRWEWGVVAQWFF